MKKHLLLFLAIALLSGSCSKDTPAPKPIADFIVDDSYRGSVSFTNKSANATRYQWDFGDGQVSTSKITGVTYTRNGTYTVTLTAKNDQGDQDAVKKNVVVNDIATTASTIFYSTNKASNVPLYVNGTYIGTLTKYFIDPNALPACGTDGGITIDLAPGTYYVATKANATLAQSTAFGVKLYECGRFRFP